MSMNQLAATCCALIVWGCCWSFVWLSNRYFHNNAPVENADVALLVALIAIGYAAKHVIEHKEIEKGDKG